MVKNITLAGLFLLLAALASPGAIGQEPGKRDGLYTPPDTTGLEHWRGNGARIADDPLDDDYISGRHNSKSTVTATAANVTPSKAVSGWKIGRSEWYILMQIAGLALLCAVASAFYFWRRYSNRLAPAELALEIVRENPSSRRVRRPSPDAASPDAAAPRKAA